MKFTYFRANIICSRRKGRLGRERHVTEATRDGDIVVYGVRRTYDGVERRETQSAISSSARMFQDGRGSNECNARRSILHGELEGQWHERT